MSWLEWITLAGWIVAGIGAAALVVWIIGRSGTHLRRCPKCRYDLSATPGFTCPECGVTARDERALRRRRRKRSLKWTGVVLGAIGLSMAGTGLVRRDGWAALAPDWVIWPALGFLGPDSLDSMITSLESARLGAAPASTVVLGGQTVRSRTGGPKPLRWERLLRARRCVTRLEADEIDIDGAISRDARLLGPESRLVADRVLDLVEGLSSEQWMNAIGCLRGFYPFDERVLRRIRPRFASFDDKTWLLAFDLVCRNSKATPVLREDMLAALNRTSPEARANAAWYFYDLTPLTAEEVKKLEVLRDADTDALVRGRAGATLARHELSPR